VDTPPRRRFLIFLRRQGLIILETIRGSVAVGAAVIAALALTACTADEAGPRSNVAAPSTGSAAACGTAKAGRVLSSSVDRIVTEAVVVRVKQDGPATAEPVAGLPGPIVPSAVPSGVASTDDLVSLLPEEHGFGTSPRMDRSAWQQEVEGLRGPLDVVWFTGVDRLVSTIELACGSGNKPTTVRLTTWSAAAEGTVACGTYPPDNSTAARAVAFCPAEQEEG
jgi:hypothetical protein